MTLSRRISPYLPYLRRFARAVTGSQTSGDAYISFMLEALIMDLSVFPKASNDKIALYQLFNHLYQQTSIRVPAPATEFAWEKQASANLACLTPQARQAFLLVSLEDFTAEEAAEILKVTTADFQALLMEATKEISAQVATRILIIEDEPLIAMDIEQLVETLGHTVVGVARTHSEAIKLYNETKPSMILADIQLADDSSGIDAVNDILKETAVPVIFITAFPERLLTGQKPEPTFLVTKPFKPDMVKALISQALFFKDKAQSTV